MMIPASLDVTLEHYGEFSNGETVLSNHRSLNENRDDFAKQKLRVNRIDQWQSLRSSFKTTSNA